MNNRDWMSLASLALLELDELSLGEAERSQIRRDLLALVGLEETVAGPAAHRILTEHPAMREWSRRHGVTASPKWSGLHRSAREHRARAGRGQGPAATSDLERSRNEEDSGWRRDETSLGQEQHQEQQRGQLEQQQRQERDYLEWLQRQPQEQFPEQRAGTTACSPSGDGKPSDVAAGRAPDVPTAAVSSLRVDEAPAQTRTVYPRLDSPASVIAGQAFRVSIGLAARPSAKTQSSVFQVPVKPFDLTMTLLTHGFRIVDGDGPHRTVRANLATPYPAVDVMLEAVDDTALERARVILVEYSIDGRLLGTASALIDVRGPGEPVRPVPSHDAPGQGWALPTADSPDVTITIAHGNDLTGGTFQWSVKSPLPVPVPRVPLITDLGERPRDWADVRSRNVESRAGDGEALRDYLEGVFAEVCDAVPAQVWPTLRAAAALTGHPTVLIVSSEPYLLWELASVPDPWDAERPALLGAQAHIARWIYRDQGEEPCPAPMVDVTSLAVVVGHYADDDRLPEAEDEAADLTRDYGAPQLPATRRALKDAVRGTPDADVLHFAGHGAFSSDNGEDGIVLEDLSMFNRTDVRGLHRARPSMVFLNACQVGRMDEELGLPSGLAPAFLLIGVQAVIAPLWKVNDAAARAVAVRFYAALASGQPVAAFLAEERVRALGGDDSALTALAYQFFGHPRLVARGELSRQANRGVSVAKGSPV